MTQIHGVRRICGTRFWTLCRDSYVGNVKLEVTHNVDPDYVISHTQGIFRDIGIRDILVQLDYYETQEYTCQNRMPISTIDQYNFHHHQH